MSIHFVKTRWHYQSYSDFWRLVELSGFPICYVDEMDLYNKHNIYILSPMNGEVRPFIDEQKGKYGDYTATFLLWNLERPGGSGTDKKYAEDNQELIDAGYVSGVLVSDRRMAEEMGFKWMPLGSHPDLGEPGTDKIYDYIHVSCYSPRRSMLFVNPGQTKGELNGVSIAHNGWGEERHLRLRWSKFMLNIHQDRFQYIEPLRFALAAAYALPIVSEFCLDVHPYEDFIGFLDYPELRQLPLFVEHYSRWADKGLQMREKMTGAWSFANCVMGNI